jgi:hypothetical protein
VSPASGIGHLRVVDGGANEPEEAEVGSGCNSVTKAAETGADRVRQMLEGALQDWQSRPSLRDLRRRLHRLLLELDSGPD